MKPAVTNKPKGHISVVCPVPQDLNRSKDWGKLILLKKYLPAFHIEIELFSC